MQDHINELREHFNRLAGLGLIWDQETMACLLLSSLPPSWSPLVMAVGASSTSGVLTFNSVAASLISEERRRQIEARNNNSDTAAALYAGSRPQPSSDIRPKCTYCGKKGHHEAVCYKKHGYPPSHPMHARQSGNKQAHVTSSSTTPEDDIVYVALDQGSEARNIAVVNNTVSPSISELPNIARDTQQHWYIDSGASMHYCCVRDWFTTFEPTSSHVALGDGRRLSVTGHGSIRLVMSMPDNKLVYSTLINVQYVPNLTVNLLSVTCMTRAGLSVHFNGDHCTIHTRTGQPAGIAHKVNSKLYRLDAHVMINVGHNTGKAYSSSAPTTISYELQLWHQRMGHVHTRAITQLFSKHMVADVASTNFLQPGSPQDFHCEACMLGKHHRTSMPSAATNRATRPLQLVHMDVCGPFSTESHNGSRYLLLIVDDFSRYTWMQAMKTKDEVFRHFQAYKAMTENAHSAQGHRVTNVRSDNGGEFISNAFNEFLRTHGIRHQRSTPYTPQQNGVVERANRTIVEAGRTMLLASNLPKSFWAEATATAVYARNRCPTSTLSNKTPYEAWTGRKPEVGHMRVFGCLAYALVTGKPDKLDAKSKPCIFIGYSSEAKAYRLYDLARRAIIESRDVTFIEHQLGISKNVGEGGHDTPNRTVPSRRRFPEHSERRIPEHSPEHST